MSKYSLGRYLRSQGAACAQESWDPCGLDLSDWATKWNSLFSCYSLSQQMVPSTQLPKTKPQELSFIHITRIQVFCPVSTLGFSQVHPLLHLFVPLPEFRCDRLSPEYSDGLIDCILASRVGPHSPSTSQNGFFYFSFVDSYLGANECFLHIFIFPFTPISPSSPSPSPLVT